MFYFLCFNEPLSSIEPLNLKKTVILWPCDNGNILWTCCSLVPVSDFLSHKISWGIHKATIKSSICAGIYLIGFNIFYVVQGFLLKHSFLKFSSEFRAQCQGKCVRWPVHQPRVVASPSPVVGPVLSLSIHG